MANVRHVFVPENRGDAEIAADDLFRGIVYVYSILYNIYYNYIIFSIYTFIVNFYSFIHLLFYLDVCFMYGFLRRMPGMGSSRREGNWWHPAMPAASSPMRSS